MAAIPAKTKENPLYDRALALSRMRADIGVEWAINFIYEWEKAVQKLSRKRGA